MMFGMDSNQLEELPPESYIGVSQKAEGGKFKRPRLFLIAEAQGKIANRYHDCASRASASLMGSVLPGVSPAAMEASRRTSLEELQRDPDSVAFLVDNY